MGLFGKSQQSNPKEMVSLFGSGSSAGPKAKLKLKVNEWTHKLRKEGYQLDRQIRAIQREEDKVKKTLKEAAKKSDRETCTILAKEIIRSRKAISRMYTSKAHLNSVQMQMKNQLATLRVAGSLARSTEVMQAMQSLVRVPEVAQTMQAMSKEMMKAGIIEEMMEETMDVLEDSEEVESAAQEEIDKILFELTEGKLGEAPAPPEAEKEAAAAAVAAPEDVEELEEMRERLSALKS